MIVPEYRSLNWRLSSRSRRTAYIILAAMAVAGCSNGGGGGLSMATTTQHGYVVSPFALEQVPVGSSKDQVLIALGSPSTTANYGNEVYYYISQTRYRAADFMREKVIDQNVVAVYFDDKSEVARIANYTVEDGVVIDSITRTTATASADENFLQEMFAGLLTGDGTAPTVGL